MINKKMSKLDYTWYEDQNFFILKLPSLEPGWNPQCPLI